MTDEVKLKRRLSSIDWTFPKADMEQFTHGIHIYPARMVPEVVNRLITALSKPKDIVFDPFCGSGTTMLVSMLSGRRGVGTEINPLAVKICQVKTTSLSPERISVTFNEICTQLKTQNYSKKFRVAKQKMFGEHLKWVDHWFQPKVQLHLFSLLEVCNSITNPSLKEFFEIVYSNTVRKVSNNRDGSYKNYKMNQDDLMTYDPNVYNQFAEFYKKAFHGMKQLHDFTEHKSEIYKPKIHCSNFLNKGVQRDSVDFIISSPPYGDSATTVGYGQFSKFSLAWLGHDVKLGSQVDRNGLGGKQKAPEQIKSDTFYDIQELVRLNELDLRNKRNVDLHIFFSDYQKALEKMYTILKEDKFLCLVLGNRTVRGIQIPMDIITTEILGDYGLKKWLSVYREIPRKRHPQSQKLYADPKWKEIKELKIAPKTISNIGRECILIMKK
jgi:hypothetical protein